MREPFYRVTTYKVVFAVLILFMAAFSKGAKADEWGNTGNEPSVFTQAQLTALSDEDWGLSSQLVSSEVREMGTGENGSAGHFLDKKCQEVLRLAQLPVNDTNIEESFFVQVPTWLRDLNYAKKGDFKVHSLLHNKIVLTSSFMKKLNLKPGDVLIVPAKQWQIVSLAFNNSGAVVQSPGSMDFMFIDGLKGKEDAYTSAPMMLVYRGYLAQEAQTPKIKRHEFALISTNKTLIKTYLRLVQQFSYRCWQVVAEDGLKLSLKKQQEERALKG